MDVLLSEQLKITVSASRQAVEYEYVFLSFQFGIVRKVEIVNCVSFLFREIKGISIDFVVCVTFRTQSLIDLNITTSLYPSIYTSETMHHARKIVICPVVRLIIVVFILWRK